MLDKLKKAIISAFEKVWDLSQEKKIDMRTASYVIALEKIIKAIENK